MIEFAILSFAAGVLTVLAPCVLPLIPVIVGGSSLHQEKQRHVSLKHPLVITTSLVVSIIVFSLLLKSTTALLGVPASVWSVISGGIVLLFGLNILLPIVWEKFMTFTRIALVANRMMGKSNTATGIRKDILLGAALGPVFNSCSPTYALIVAAILPVSFGTGLVYLIAYSIGLGAMLLLISSFGRILINRLKWMSNPHGIFQKIIGTLFIVIGICLLFGIEKRVQSYVLEQGWYDPIMQIEQRFQR